MPKQKPDPVDVSVGARLRVLRLKAGISQERLADRVGLTFQQVQKYEKGSNRIAASRLDQFAKILKVPVATLFGEDGKGVPVQLDTRLTTATRLAIIGHLDALDDRPFETALAGMLERLVTLKG